MQYKESSELETIGTPCIDFSKHKQVPEDSIESKLFQIIDNIDTLFDVHKPVKYAFEKDVLLQLQKAHTLITSDGFKLYYVKQKKE